MPGGFRERMIFAGVLALPFFAFACQGVVGIDDFSGRTQAPSACAVLPPFKEDDAGLSLMSRIDLPTSTCFWMDRKEVTVEQYRRWQDAVPKNSVSNWDPQYCAWKTARTDPIGDPNDACAASISPIDLDPFEPDKPMRCVDFCEAAAFCDWNGKKHLCHAIDGLGVQGPREAVREWTIACSNGFTTRYPWGNQVGDAERCNTGQSATSCISSRPVCGVLPTGEKSNCATPGNVVDLLGNVAEWVFSCNLVDPNQSTPTACQIRGGGYDQELIDCNVEGTRTNDTRSPSLGFRCCDTLTLAEQIEVLKH